MYPTGYASFQKRFNSTFNMIDTNRVSSVISDLSNLFEATTGNTVQVSCEDVSCFDYAEFLHEAFCANRHVPNRASCGFDAEMTEDGDWQWDAPEHAAWMRVAEQFMAQGITFSVAEHLISEVKALAQSA